MLQNITPLPPPNIVLTTTPFLSFRRIFQNEENYCLDFPLIFLIGILYFSVIRTKIVIRLIQFWMQDCPILTYMQIYQYFGAGTRS